MPIITEGKTWIPLYILIVLFFIIKFQYKSWIPLVILAACVGISDKGSAGIIKPLVERTRPCNEVGVKARVVGVECRNSFSFPSSHATNHLCIAMFLTILFRKEKWYWHISWFIWAILIAYSRIYVGVHYPLDIIGGGILGAVIGYCGGKLTLRFVSKKQ